MLKYNGIPFKVDYNDDGSFILKVNPYVVNSKHIIIWEYENDKEMLILYYLVNHIKSKSRNPIHLILPYVPYSEFDYFDSDHIFILKYFCNFINSLNLEKIRILDPYSNVCAALLNNVEISDVMPYINLACEKTHSDNLFVYYPNKRIKNKYYFKLGKNICGEFFENRDVLVITDYINENSLDLGDISQEIKSGGADSVYLYGTHYKYSDKEQKWLNDYNKIFVANLMETETIPTGTNIEVINEINNAIF